MSSQAKDVRSERCIAELEVLDAVYGQEIVHISLNQLKISIPLPSEAFEPLVLSISVGEGYPATSSPSFTLGSLKNGRWLTADRERKLLTSLKALYDPEDNDNIMRAIEWIRESAYGTMELSESDLVLPNTSKTSSKSQTNLQAVVRPTIYHSHRLTDRKSKFQAHFARCWSEEEVKNVIEAVRADPKCSQAVHPCIFAWRLEGASQGEELVGSSDDGEGGAAAFLESLLQTRRIVNGILMVTRWFGGTLLGPDRFRHITSISEYLLNHIFDRHFLKDPNSSFHLLASASNIIQQHQTAKDGSPVDLLLSFASPGQEVSNSTLKLSAALSNKFSSPMHRLVSISLPDGTQLWTNEIPTDISIPDSPP